MSATFPTNPTQEQLSGQEEEGTTKRDMAVHHAKRPQYQGTECRHGYQSSRRPSQIEIPWMLPHVPDGAERMSEYFSANCNTCQIHTVVHVCVESQYAEED